jgi:Domain of unknown function (DUF5668)
MGRLFWGLVVIVLGVLFLAANLGWIDVGFVLSLWRLWPLILVVIGLNLLLGGRNRSLAAVLIILIVAGGLGIAWAGWHSGSPAAFGGGTVTTTPITQPANPAVTSGSADISVGSAEVVIQGQSAARGLVVGTFTTGRTPKISQGVTNGAYSLNVGTEGQGGVWILPWMGVGSERERLELGLSPAVPWTVRVDGGATKTEIDLTTVRLQDLNVDAGASSVRVIVGSTVAEGAQVTINGSVGSYHVTLPRALRVNLTLDSSLSSKNLEGFRSTGADTYVHDGSGMTLHVHIKASVSSVRVDLR